MTNGIQTEMTGEILYEAEQSYIRIISPVEQRVIQSAGEMLIWYPLEERVFLIHTNDDPALVDYTALPTVNPFDTLNFISSGLILTSRKTNGNITNLQYTSGNYRERFPAITLTFEDENLLSVNIVTSRVEYQKIDQIEYQDYSGEKYLKTYRVTTYFNTKELTQTMFNNNTIRDATAADLKRLIFSPPNSIPIEHKYLN